MSNYKPHNGTWTLQRLAVRAPTQYSVDLYVEFNVEGDQVTCEYFADENNISTREMDRNEARRHWRELRREGFELVDSRDSLTRDVRGT